MSDSWPCVTMTPGLGGVTGGPTVWALDVTTRSSEPGQAQPMSTRGFVPPRRDTALTPPPAATPATPRPLPPRAGSPLRGPSPPELPARCREGATSVSPEALACSARRRSYLEASHSTGFQSPLNPQAEPGSERADGLFLECARRLHSRRSSKQLGIQERREGAGGLPRRRPAAPEHPKLTRPGHVSPLPPHPLQSRGQPPPPGPRFL